MKKANQTKEKSLKDLIKQSGLTQRQLAERLGVAVSTVGYWVAEDMMPSFENVCRMSEILQVPLNEFAKSLNLPYHEPFNPSAASWQFHQALMEILCDLL